jgi:methyl-accepting chemotaxis protein
VRSSTKLVQQTLSAQLDQHELIEHRDREIRVMADELREVNAVLKDLDRLAQSQSDVIQAVSDLTDRAATNAEKGLEEIRRRHGKHR